MSGISKELDDDSVWEKNLEGRQSALVRRDWKESHCVSGSRDAVVDIDI